MRSGGRGACSAIEMATVPAPARYQAMDAVKAPGGVDVDEVVEVGLADGELWPRPVVPEVPQVGPDSVGPVSNEFFRQG